MPCHTYVKRGYNAGGCDDCGCGARNHYAADAPPYATLRQLPPPPRAAPSPLTPEQRTATLVAWLNNVRDATLTPLYPLTKEEHNVIGLWNRRLTSPPFRAPQ